MKMKRRLQWIDMAKCLGILIVLMNHGNVKIPYVNFAGGMFYVPIFFMVAGYTYRVGKDSFWEFLKTKAKRLLIPYFLYNLFLFAFFFIKDSILTGNVTIDSFFPLLGIVYSRNCLYPMTSADNIYFMTVLNAPTWFLTALFVSLVIYEAITRLCKNNYRQMSIFVLAGMLFGNALYVFCPVLLPWSLDSVWFFVIWIHIGYYLKKRHRIALLWKDRILLAAYMVMLFAGCYYNGSANISVGDFGRNLYIGIINAALASLVVMLLCALLEGKIPKVITDIGEHTLDILCMHLFVFMFIKTGLDIVLPIAVKENVMLMTICNMVMVLTAMLLITYVKKGLKHGEKNA